MRLNQITISCTDYIASVQFYQTIGLRLIVNSPGRYARFECPAQNAADDPPTLSLHQVSEDTPIGETVIYLETSDVDADFAAWVQAGLVPEKPPIDQNWLWREAYFKDPAGNRICLYHAGENRRFPPWRVAG